MITTQGFQVQAQPYLPAVDPRLLASDPSQISNGVLQAFNVGNTFDRIKAFRAQQAEQDATRADRLAQIHAASQTAVRQNQEGEATSAARVGNELATLGLSTAQATGNLEDLPEVRNLAAKQRQFETVKANFDIGNYANAALGKQALEKAQTEYYEAESEWRRAEAKRAAALADAAGLPKDDATKKWEEKIGNIAAVTGISVGQARQLYSSGLKNKDGVPLSTELANISELVGKPNFFLNPYDKMSPELAHWLGNDGVAALQQYGANHADPAEVKKAVNASVPAAGAAAQPATPQVIKVDAKGNIQREKQAPAAAPASQAAPQQDQASGSSAGVNALRDLATLAPAVLRGGVSTGLSADTLLKARALARLASVRAGGLGAMAGNAAGAIGRVAGRAYLPIAAMDVGNRNIGNMLSDKTTGPMTALEGMAAASQAPSFDESAEEAKYDELSQRIRMTMQSGRLTDAQKQQELQSLLAQRELIWSIMHRQAGSDTPLREIGGGL